jgi:hypothetical protein
MAGLVPAIHDELQNVKQYCRSGGAVSWIAGSSLRPGRPSAGPGCPAMTVGGQYPLQIVSLRLSRSSASCPRMTPMFWRRLFLFRYGLFRLRLFHARPLRGRFLYGRCPRGFCRRRHVAKRLRRGSFFRNGCKQRFGFCQEVLQLNVVGELPENRLRDFDGVGRPDTLL